MNEIKLLNCFPGTVGGVQTQLLWRNDEAFLKLKKLKNAYKGNEFVNTPFRPSCSRPILIVLVANCMYLLGQMVARLLVYAESECRHETIFSRRLKNEFLIKIHLCLLLLVL